MENSGMKSQPYTTLVNQHFAQDSLSKADNSSQGGYDTLRSNAKSGKSRKSRKDRKRSKCEINCSSIGGHCQPFNPNNVVKLSNYFGEVYEQDIANG